MTSTVTASIDRVTNDKDDEDTKMFSVIVSNYKSVV